MWPGVIFILMINFTKHCAKLKFFLGCAGVALLLTGCNEDDKSLSDIALFIKPEKGINVEISSGEKQRYEVEISTIYDYVASLTVTSFDRQYGEITLLSEDYNTKKVSTTVIYTAPQFSSENNEVSLTFIATDNKGNVAKVERTLTVNTRLVALPEKTGIVLYSPFSGMPDALSLSDVSRPFNLDSSPEPEIADIFLVSNEDFTSVAWQSNTKTKFIRNNTFNYTEASAISINAVYSSSVRMDLINDIQPNDVIIVGHGEIAQGVFLVTTMQSGLNGPNGYASDYMIVSYKGIDVEVESPVPTPGEEDNSEEKDTENQ